MTKPSELTLAFIKRRPESAARVLASMPITDAAALVDLIPTRYSVAVFQALSAREAALILSHLGIDSATAIIREMEFGAATAVLRRLKRSDRTAFLNVLPVRRKRHFEMALTFAPGSVGYRMTTDIPALSHTRTADDGLNLIKQSDNSSVDSVAVVDDQRKYLGAVNVLTLLRSPGDAELATLVDSSLLSLSPNASLEQVRKYSAWNNCAQLPVISRRGELLGALHRKSLEMIHVSDVSPAPGARSTAALVVGAMFDCTKGLAGMLAEPPSVQDTQGE